MNKRSSRLVAWLLTLVMVLNMSPISAFATPKSNEVKGPTYPIIDTLSNDPVPTEKVAGGYTVQYVVKAEYT